MNLVLSSLKCEWGNLKALKIKVHKDFLGSFLAHLLQNYFHPPWLNLLVRITLVLSCFFFRKVLSQSILQIFASIHVSLGYSRVFCAVSAETCTIDISFTFGQYLPYCDSKCSYIRTRSVLLVQCGGAATREAARHWEVMSDWLEVKKHHHHVQKL